MITDAVLITLYAALAVFVVATTVSFSVHGLQQRLSNAYLWINVCLMGWLVVTVAYHVTASPHLAEYLDNLCFPFIAFLPVLMLQFTVRFYRANTYISKVRTILLCAIPVLTTIFSVVPSLSWLMRTNYSTLQMYPLHRASYEWGFWFYIHAGYCYILMVYCIWIAVRQYKKQSKEYKLPSALMIVGILLTYLSDIPSFNIPDSIIDNTLIGVCLSMVVLHFAVVNNPAVEFLAVARKALYKNMRVPVFILDRREHVLDMNQEAYKMMEELGCAEKDISYLTLQDVNDAIVAAGGEIRDGYADENAHHILVPLGGETVVLSQTRNELMGKRGRHIGSYVAMMDITAMSRMVDELQYKAEVDVLTGIPNRRAFERRIMEMDKPKNLPISFIVGDVNHLKQVNDKLGHRQGDILLKTVAEILTEVCPAGGFAARMGGDEFIMVVQNCNEECAKEVVSAITRKLRSNRKLFSGASIALGHITKTRPEQDAKELIHSADQMMYSQKQYDRRKES